MKRTLTVVLTAAAFLVPAGAASAAPSPDRVHSDASCNNGSGGNDKGEYNGKGHMADRLDACVVPRLGIGGDGYNT